MENISRPIIGILGVPTYDNENDKSLLFFTHSLYRENDNN